MLVSVVILIVVSIFLALGLYLAEVRVNPDFGYGDALLWNFVKYVDDPAEMTSAPVTLLGKIFGTLVGLINVAIFGSGLIDAMEETRHEKKIAEASVQLHKRFRRIAQSDSWFLDENKRKKTYKFVPRYCSLVHLHPGIVEDCRLASAPVETRHRCQQGTAASQGRR